MADARGGAAASFRLFIAATEWLCARSGRGGLPPALLAEHRSGMATPLAVATAALEAAFACRPGAASALSGVTPVALLPGHGAAALRLLAFLADIGVGVGGKGSGGGVAGGPATAAAVHWAEDEAPEEVEERAALAASLIFTARLTNISRMRLALRAPEGQRRFSSKKQRRPNPRLRSRLL